VWAVGVYGLASLVDAYFSRQTLHLDQSRLLAAGGFAAVLTVVALVLLTLLLLGRSSRAHRLLVNTGLTACLAAPLFGLQAVSDLNRAFDRDSTTVVATVSRRWEAGAGRGYYIEVANSSISPGVLRVSPHVFSSVQDGMTVPIVIGEGRLDIPWLRSINGVTVGD
jgi:hypothetical protein